MTILTILTTIGVLLVALSAWPYIRAVLRGRVRPKLVSWAIWTVLAIIMTLAGLSEGQLESTVLTAVTALTCGTVVILGWRRGTVQFTRLDIACLVGAIVGIGVFFIARDPTIALIISVAVDALAFAPTLAHGWTDPDEESLSSFAIAAAGELLVVVAATLGGATFAGLLYPVYALVFNSVMTILLVAGRSPEVDLVVDERV